MPLRVPNLDDRTYDDLVEEATAMLPRYAPAWTNHNPSDPGITLIELLAYFTELLIYRLNRVTRETKIRFLQLLWGAEKYDKSRWAELSADEVEEGLRQAVRDLRRTERAVTAEDYEYLVREATAQNPDDERILRARPFARRNLEAPEDKSRENDAPGHISIVVLPAGELARDAIAVLLSQVRQYLEPRRLLATRLHVVQPFFLWVKLSATIHLRPDAGEDLRSNAPENALKKLQSYFSPLLGGGPQGEGWPFGRALYLSEVYEALEQVEGVDYVEDVDVLGISTQDEPIDKRDHIGIKVGRSIIGTDSRLGAAPEHGRDRILSDSAGRLIGIALRPYELIRIASHMEDFSSGEPPAIQRSAPEQNYEVAT
jgi:hypothetical protein